MIQSHSVVSFIIQDRDPFRNPAQSMLKTMVMTTGEFEFDTIFFATQLDFVTVSYIIWIVFVILMPVLLTNLLVRGWAIVIDPICNWEFVKCFLNTWKTIFENLCILNSSLSSHLQYSMTGWFGCWWYQTSTRRRWTEEAGPAGTTHNHSVIINQCITHHKVELALSAEKFISWWIGRRYVLRKSSKVYPNRQNSAWEYLQSFWGVERFDAPTRIARATQPQHVMQYISRIKEVDHPKCKFIHAKV